MTNSSPWYGWPIEIDGLPSYKMGGSFHGYVSHNQRVMCFCFFKPKDGGNQAVAVMATFPRWTLRLRGWNFASQPSPDGLFLPYSGYPKYLWNPMDLWIIDENQAYILYIYNTVFVRMDGWTNAWVWSGAQWWGTKGLCVGGCSLVALNNAHPIRYYWLALDFRDAQGRLQ